MPRKIIVSIVFAASALFLSHGVDLAARTESTSYIIFGDVISTGGAESSDSASYSLSDTIGEAIILSATSTSSGYGIKAGFRELYADQFVTLTIADTTVNLGTLSSSDDSTDSHTMVIATNATNGMSVTVSGNTLTSGGNTITAIGGTETASSPGTEQFGINLVANTSPAVGSGASGTSPIGAAANHYNVANSFAFSSGNTVATSTGAINSTTLTVSYVANISSATEDGTYTTTLTYAATGSF